MRATLPVAPLVPYARHPTAVGAMRVRRDSAIHVTTEGIHPVHRGTAPSRAAAALLLRVRASDPRVVARTRC